MPGAESFPPRARFIRVPPGQADSLCRLPGKLSPGHIPSNSNPVVNLQITSAEEDFSYFPLAFQLAAHQARLEATFSSKSPTIEVTLATISLTSRVHWSTKACSLIPARFTRTL
jgi:hypothetical protein